MTKVKIELDSKYREYIDFLKQAILSDNGKEIESDEEIVEMLIENFVGLVEEQQAHHHHHHNGEGCCGTCEH